VGQRNLVNEDGQCIVLWKLEQHLGKTGLTPRTQIAVIARWLVAVRESNFCIKNALHTTGFGIFDFAVVAIPQLTRGGSGQSADAQYDPDGNQETVVPASIQKGGKTTGGRHGHGTPPRFGVAFNAKSQRAAERDKVRNVS